MELMHSNMFVWIYAKVLLGKQNLLAPLFLHGIQFIFPCQIGQEAAPLEGEAVASGPATIHLNSPALVMLRVTE